jgi:hypothetical protein
MKSFKFNGFRLFGLLGCVVVLIGLILYSHFVVLAGYCLWSAKCAKSRLYLLLDY